MKISPVYERPAFESIQKSSEPAVKEFQELFEEFVAEINDDLKAAGVAKEKLLQGDVSNIEELMVQIQKADISLRLITEIRNKALESYQEIMRMQV